MSNRTLGLDDTLYRYLVETSLREHPVLEEVRLATRRHPHAGWQISPEQGQLMALLVRLMGARQTLEIGVFTGYSTLAVALALPDEGRIIACDVSAEYTDAAKSYWERAGVAHKIDLRLAPAADTLARLLDEGRGGQFDFAFIDADKKGYDVYYERSLALLRSGGLIAIDNVLWDGRVAKAAETPDTAAIQAFNDKLHDDPRIDLSLVPIGDGLTLARKR